MQLTTGFLGATVLIAFSLVAACGGDDNGGTGGKGGAGGKGGTSSGSGGKGGTTSGGGKSGASSTGGSANGGGGKASGGSSSGSGGFGIGGFGGAFNPDDYACDPVPEDGSACQAGDQPCIADNDVCACIQEEWNCIDIEGTGGSSGQIGNIDCPPAKPTSGTPCGDSIGFCPYGSGANAGCACYQGEWACTP